MTALVLMPAAPWLGLLALLARDLGAVLLAGWICAKAMRR